MAKLKEEYNSRIIGELEQKLGTTIQKEIMSSRLEIAQHLLSTTHRPLGETAKLSGFKSTQYLCLCFQSHFGCTPLAYRRKCLP